MFGWPDEKDALLRKDRGIGFQEVVFHIEQGDIVAITEHPNKKKYPNQKIIYILIEDYIYMVPFIENEDTRFLKTIIPSRRATRKYLEEKK